MGVGVPSGWLGCYRDTTRGWNHYRALWTWRYLQIVVEWACPSRGNEVNYYFALCSLEWSHWHRMALQGLFKILRWWRPKCDWISNTVTSLRCMNRTAGGCWYWNGSNFKFRSRDILNNILSHHQLKYRKISLPATRRLYDKVTMTALEVEGPAQVKVGSWTCGSGAKPG